ncbi:helix-turn-helix transcriptional regulator [Acuticoccus sp.]|uniref:helix-turn-helix transcriptional regulator n=1 Tax=Acuticoccus sp. TaxID=1904378 RepID=UPI003B52F54E
MTALADPALDVNRALGAVRDHFGLKHVTSVVARFGSDPEKDPFVRTTYSAEWLGRYFVQRYWSIDPILRAGFKRATPFDWSEIEVSTSKVAAFFYDAQRHDIGASGYCIPLTNKWNQRGIMTVSSDLTGSAWTVFTQAHLSQWLEIGSVLHRRCCEELFAEVPPTPKLSPREREALSWVAEGKEVPDIAIITNLSAHTVRTYLKSARMKLDCGTMAQAAVKAERLGILPTSIA